MSQIQPKHSSPNRPRIAICGGGIGGLALAMDLRQRGYAPVVYERRTPQAIADQGLFLTLAPNGINALRGIGLADAVIAKGIAMAGMAIHNAQGRRLTLIDGRSHQARFGAPSVTIRRGHLSALLLEATRKAGIDLRLGTQVSGVREGADAVSVATADGGHDEHDIVVACDGLRSQVRAQIFPDLPQPRYSGLIGTGGFVEMADFTPTGGVMTMCFGHRAFFGYIKAPGSPLYWFGSYAAPESEAGPIGDPAAAARHLRALHADDPLGIPGIVARIAALPGHYPIHDMPQLPRWHTERVVLMGDAAHAVAPHSGQGASMALEDAAVLSACLAADTQPGNAFARFEALRRERTAAAIRIGRMSGSQKAAQGWLAQRLRDLILPLVMPMGVRAQESLYGYRADLEPLETPRAAPNISSVNRAR